MSTWVPKKRELIYIIRSRKVYLDYFDEWTNDVTYREYSSFPSESSSGYPNRLYQHNLNALSYKEWISSTRIYKNGWLYGLSTTPDQYLEPDHDFKTAIQNMAINKAMSSFMSGKQQLAADFGQRQKSIDMITKRVRQAYDVLRFVKKGNLYAAVRTLKGGRAPVSKKLAHLRLEFVYGWRPLVQTIYDVSQKEFPPNPEMYISECVTKPFMESYGNMRTEGRVRATYSMLVEMTAPVTASASKLGLVNPASVAWELVPFSFIVDWFIPISTYLDSLTAFSGFKVTDKCLSYTEKLYMENYVKSGGYGRTKTKKLIERNVHVAPSFRPFLKNPLSVAHALNALALIRVLRKK